MDFTPAAYLAMALNMSQAAGIDHRFGPDAAAYGVTNAGRPTLFQRRDNFSRCDGPALPDGSNCISSWQVGGPRKTGEATNDQAAAGIYSTTQASVLFLADDPKVRAGVGELQVGAIEFNTFSQRPQLPWQVRMAPTSGLDSYTVTRYRAGGLLPGDGTARPVAQARCGGRVGFCAASVIAFQNGVLGTAGSNTAHNQASTRLAPNKVPTAIAMTNDSEFALVTVWDTVAVKAQVAVVALAGLCDGCALGGPYYDWWAEWFGVYPGLPNMGNIAFMKVLGYVDLPSDIKAPTDIAVTTGMDQFKTTNQGRFIGMGTPLTQDANRQTFLGSGINSDKYARSAVAVVISKEEQKVAFIDLKPLFTYVNSVYFGSQSDTNFANTVVNNLGQGDSQWPHTFAFKPQQTPTVIKTMTLDQRPTAVRTTVFGGGVQRAWVATQDGSLRIFSLGNYVAGGAATPADIVEKGRVAIGRNPTSLAISKLAPDGNNSIEPLNQQVLVASRGDRKIQWVRFAADGNSGSVLPLEIKDARMVDPIAVEDVDNFANLGSTLSVADYDGKKVHNFRYGPVIFADRGPSWSCQPPQGCPVTPTGGVKVEYGGAYTMQGKPFQINTSNVP